MEQSILVLAGSNGFLGRHLTAHFQQLGYQVVCLARDGRGDLRWDGRTPGPWVAALEGADLLINLAGRSVDCRYSEANRRAILTSRVESTQVLAAAVAACTRPPRVWLNASTATIYPDTPGAAPANTEASATPGATFSEQVGLVWEQAFFAAAVPAATRRVALRTAIVLGGDGGAFPVMARLARFGLCTPQAGGRQWISWLHVRDFCRAVEFVAETEALAGAVNLCAPHPLPNAGFNALLAAALNPPLRFPQPRLLLEAGAWLLRTETELILKSRKVYPARLLAAGFEFEYPGCGAAVGELLGIKAKAPQALVREKQRKELFGGFLKWLGILLSMLGGFLLMIPYIGIVFLPITLLSNVLILAAPLSTRARVGLVLFPYVAPIALYTFILLR